MRRSEKGLDARHFSMMGGSSVLAIGRGSDRIRRAGATRRARAERALFLVIDRLAVATAFLCDSTADIIQKGTTRWWKPKVFSYSPDSVGSRDWVIYPDRRAGPRRPAQVSQSTGRRTCGATCYLPLAYIHRPKSWEGEAPAEPRVDSQARRRHWFQARQEPRPRSSAAADRF